MIYCTVYAIFLYDLYYYDDDDMKCDSINFMLFFFWDGLTTMKFSDAPVLHDINYIPQGLWSLSHPSRLNNTFLRYGQVDDSSFDIWIIFHTALPKHPFIHLLCPHEIQWLEILGISKWGKYTITLTSNLKKTYPSVCFQKGNFLRTSETNGHSSFIHT